MIIIKIREIYFKLQRVRNSGMFENLNVWIYISLIAKGKEPILLYLSQHSIIQ